MVTANIGTIHVWLPIYPAHAAGNVPPGAGYAIVEYGQVDVAQWDLVGPHGNPIVDPRFARAPLNRTRATPDDVKQTSTLLALPVTRVSTGQLGSVKRRLVANAWTTVVVLGKDGPMQVDWWLAAGEVQTLTWTLSDANGPVDIHTWLGASITVASPPLFASPIISARSMTILDDGTVGNRGKVQFSTLAGDTSGKPGHYWARITALRPDATPEMFPNAPPAGTDPSRAYIQVQVTPS